MKFNKLSLPLLFIILLISTSCFAFEVKDHVFVRHEDGELVNAEILKIRSDSQVEVVWQNRSKDSSEGGKKPTFIYQVVALSEIQSLNPDGPISKQPSRFMVGDFVYHDLGHGSVGVITDYDGGYANVEYETQKGTEVAFLSDSVLASLNPKGPMAVGQFEKARNILDFKIGDTVLIPRSKGGPSPAVIVSRSGEKYRMEWTERGENVLDKTLAYDNLVKFNPRGPIHDDTISLHELISQKEGSIHIALTPDDQLNMEKGIGEKCGSLPYEKYSACRETIRKQWIFTAASRACIWSGYDGATSQYDVKELSMGDLFDFEIRGRAFKPDESYINRIGSFRDLNQLPLQNLIETMIQSGVKVTNKKGTRITLDLIHRISSDQNSSFPNIKHCGHEGENRVLLNEMNVREITEMLVEFTRDSNTQFGTQRADKGSIIFTHLTCQVWDKNRERNLKAIQVKTLLDSANPILMVPNQKNGNSGLLEDFLGAWHKYDLIKQTENSKKQ